MALEKSIGTAIGVPATYWRVVRVRVDLGEPRTVRYELAGYASAETRRDGKQAMCEEEFGFALPDEVSVEELDRAMLYAHARQAEHFADAIDV